MRLLIRLIHCHVSILLLNYKQVYTSATMFIKQVSISFLLNHILSAAVAQSVIERQPRVRKVGVFEYHPLQTKVFKPGSDTRQQV